MNFSVGIDFSWTTSKDDWTMKRFWFTPILFHKFGPDGYTHIVPPLFISLRWNNGESYWHLLPPILWSYRSIDYSYDYTTRKSEQIYKDSFLSILFSRYTSSRGEKGWDEEPYRVTMWAPLVPLGFYYHRNRDRNHLNILTLLDFSWRTKDEGTTGWSINRFWFMPFVFKKFGDEGYLHVPLALTFSWDSAESVYDPKTRTMVKDYRSHVVSPVFYRSTRSQGGRKWDEDPYYETRWFGLFLPLYYRHTDQGGSHSNLFWLFDWSRNRDDSLKRFWAMPFLFHKPGPKATPTCSRRST